MVGPRGLPNIVPHSTPHQHRHPLGYRRACIKVMARWSGALLFTQTTHSFVRWMRFVLSSAARVPPWLWPRILRPSFRKFLLRVKIVPGAQSQSQSPGQFSGLTVDRSCRDTMTRPHPVYYHAPTIRHRRIHIHLRYPL